MFEDRRVSDLLVAPSGSEDRSGYGIETRLREAIEKVVEAFGAIELKYGATLEEALDYLEAHGQGARTILYERLEKIDSDIYGRLVADSVSYEEVQMWISEVIEWERAACRLANKFEHLKRKSTRPAVILA